jgi:hypothetical protein
MSTQLPRITLSVFNFYSFILSTYKDYQHTLVVFLASDITLPKPAPVPPWPVVAALPVTQYRFILGPLSGNNICLISTKLSRKRISEQVRGIIRI